MSNDWLRDSCPYREIFREGFFEGFAEGFIRRFRLSVPELQLVSYRAWLLYLGRKWLGSPPARAEEIIAGIDDESKLKSLITDLCDVQPQMATWAELLHFARDFPSTDRPQIR